MKLTFIRYFPGARGDHDSYVRRAVLVVLDLQANSMAKCFLCDYICTYVFVRFGNWNVSGILYIARESMAGRPIDHFLFLRSQMIMSTTMTVNNEKE
jgi:hypothetical protein